MKRERMERIAMKEECVMSANRKLGIIGGALLLGVVAYGGDAGAQSAPSIMRVVPMQAAAACTPDLREGVPFEDHHQHPDAACKLKIATHNKMTWMKKLTSAIGIDKAQAESQVRAWEHAVGVATVATAERDYHDFRAAAAKAVGGAKAAAEAAVTGAEKRLHDAIDAHEKDIEKHAAEVRAKLAQLSADAKKHVDEMKQKFQTAVGDAKHQFEHGLLMAEHAEKRIEEVLATNDLVHAERKLAAASKRVHAQAAAVRAKFQAEYDHVRARVEGIHKRLRAEMDHIKSKIAAVSSKVKNIAHTVQKVHDEISHVESSVKNIYNKLFG